MKKLLILGALAALVAGALLLRSTSRGTAAGTDAPSSAESPRAEPASSAAAAGATLEAPAPKHDAPTADSRTQIDVSSASQAAQAARQAEHRRLAAELLKLYPPGQPVEPGGDAVGHQRPAWDVGPESVTAKYGALDKAGVQRALDDLNALLAWQNEGPFEDKHAEVLHVHVILALETERDWLQMRVNEL